MCGLDLKLNQINLGFQSAMETQDGDGQAPADPTVAGPEVEEQPRMEHWYSSIIDYY